MKLLCVDDNGTHRKMLNAMLSRSGIDIDFACNGREAVDAYEVSEYDAILMDMEMPVLSGLEATREIRQIEHGFHLGHTPILFLTGHADGDQLDQAQAVGGDGHLIKPFTPEALFGAIKRVMQCPQRAEFDPGLTG